MGLMMLWLVLAVHHVAGERSHAQHQVYNNVFFNPPSHTGRPSTSFVMVKSHDGRSYQLSNSGVSFIFSNDPAKKHKRQDGSHVAEELSSNSLTLPVSQCPEMAAKPDEMCVNKTSSCWSQGQPDVDCPGFGLCCFDGCVARCVESFPKDEVVQDRVVGGSCPQVEDRDPSQCSGATANCWSRGVPDVDCPNFGLCCYDGCVNTCLRDIDYDQSLSQGLEDDDEEEDDEYDDELDDQLDDELDDEYDDELGDQLDDDLDDDLGDQLDEYGAPKAAPIKYISDIDSYGSPLAGPVTSYQDILGNDLRTLSKKEHSGPIVTRNTIAGVRPFLYQSGPTGLGNLGKTTNRCKL